MDGGECFYEKNGRQKKGDKQFLFEQHMQSFTLRA